MSKRNLSFNPYFDSLPHMLSDEVSPPAFLKQHFLTDYEKAKAFLLSYRGSVDTFNAYRREIERFLQWSYLVANKSLTQILRDDFDAYLAFCQKPPHSWIGLKNEPRFIEKNSERIPNSKWRPFVATVSKIETQSGKQPDKKEYVLSNKALKAVFAVISSFYNFLIQEGYTLINPVLLIRQKSRYLKAYQRGGTICPPPFENHQKYPAFLRSSIAASLALSSARVPRSVTRAAATSPMMSSTLSAGDSIMPVLIMSAIVRTRTTSCLTGSFGFGRAPA